MAQTSWPFENIDTTETQFSQWARNINEGIRQGSGSELAVTAPGGGMTVEVAAGQAMIRGHYYSNSATETLTITTADATNPRIDSVVLELNPTANTVIVKVLTGTPAGSPVAPSLTQTDSGIYQLRLANVAVAAGALSISSGNLTDLRTYMFAGIGKWTTATRPANPVQYQTTGYNTTIGAHEFWNGSSWVGFADPITTRGDLIVGGVGGAPERLAVGTADQVLTSDGTDVYWATASSGGFDIALPGFSGTGRYQFTNSVTLDDFDNGKKYCIVPANNNYFITNSDTGIPQKVVAWTPPFLSASDPGYHRNFLFTAGASTEVEIKAAISQTDYTLSLSFAINGASNNWLQGVYGGYLYATANNGLWRTSDGTTWTQVLSATFTSDNKLAYNGSIYVISGYTSSDHYTSTNGTSWTARTSPMDLQQAGFAAGNGLFVWAGRATSGAYCIKTSTDGTSWTTRYTESSSTYRLFGQPLYNATNGYWYVRGNSDPQYSVYSSNGTSWSRTGVTGLGYTLSLIDGLFIAANANNNYYYSATGASWTSQAMTVTPNTYQVKASGGGITNTTVQAIWDNWIKVDSTYYAWKDDLVISSSDRINWTWPKRFIPTNITTNSQNAGSNYPVLFDGNWYVQYSDTHIYRYPNPWDVNSIAPTGTFMRGKETDIITI